jgi:hypothetical protein
MNLPDEILALVKTKRIEAELLHHWGSGSLWEDIADPAAEMPAWDDSDLRTAVSNLMGSDYAHECTTPEEWVSRIGSI